MSNPPIVVIYGVGSKIEGNTHYVEEHDFLSPAIDLNINRFALSTFQQISHITIHGKKIYELFSYDNMSLWWLIYIPVILKFIKTVNFITNLTNFFKTHNVKQFFLKNDFELFDIIQQLCNKYSIKFSYSKIDLFKMQTKQRLSRNTKHLASSTLVSRKMQNRKRLSSTTSYDLSKKILFFVPTSYRRQIFDSRTNKEIDGDWIVGNLLKYFNPSDVALVDYFSKLNDDDLLFKKRLNSNYFWLPIEEFFSDTKNNSHTEFLLKYNKILSNDSFQKVFVYDSIKLWNVLQSTFSKMTDYFYIPFWLQLHDSLLLSLDVQKPHAIFLPYEYGPISLSIISAAKKLNIPTFGLAHAAIYEYQYGYSHNVFQSEFNPYGFILPDHILLFGQFSKNVLEKIGYPSEKLTVFGNPSYFEIEKIKSSFNNESIRKKYNIPLDNKIILFTSNMYQERYSYQGKFIFDTLIWKELISNFSNSSQITIILKPHPREQDVSIYENIIKENKTHNALILNQNLLELLSITDVLISMYSNTMLDALCFNKPVVRLKFQNIPHSIPYDEEEVVLPTTLENLANSIQTIFSEPDVIKNLEKNRKEFVQTQFNIPNNDPKKILDDLLK